MLRGPEIVEERPLRPSAPSAYPLSAAFDDLAEFRGLLLAVSGGPDSLALMWMAAKWAVGRGAAPNLRVATVDHALRPGSRAEAEHVGTVAQDLGLPHRILSWEGPHPRQGLQARARAARYALLEAEALRGGCDAILTAHHADDQAETVLMRLTRGSGVTGLAGMRARTILASGLTLARPLLGWSKADLVALCRAEGLAFVEDPTNTNEAYLRARLRRDAARWTDLGLDRATLTRLAARMARADAALESQAEAVFASCRRPGASVRLSLAGRQGLEEEFAVRLLRRAVLAAGGREPIRLERLERLRGDVWAALRGGRSHAGTLAGTRLRLSREGVLEVVPEAPRQRGRPRAAEG